MRPWSVLCVGVVLCSQVNRAGAASVAVAPLSSTSPEEYQWVGPALAHALSLRIHREPELSALSSRQVSAALRSEGLSAADVNDVAKATQLGKVLGADTLFVGSFTAAWPNIEVAFKVVEPQRGVARPAHSISGDLGNLAQLEVRLAEVMARELGARPPKVVEGAIGTTSLRAWRELTLGAEIIAWQSLGPQAADAKTPLSVPPEALRRALEHLEQATRQEPELGEAWAALGITQALLGDPRAAWRAFGKATALGFGHHPSTVLGAAFVRMREGRWDDAERVLLSAIARHPGFLHARATLGELYAHRHNYAKALALFDDYLKAAPAQPWALVKRGHAKSRLGDHLGAISDTIAATEVLPRSAWVLIELASRYIDAGKLIGAEDALLQAQSVDPDNARVYVRLSYIYLLLGDDDTAITVGEKALKLTQLDGTSRDRAYAHLNMARALGHKGQLDAAFVHLTKAKENGLPSMEEIEKDERLAQMRGDARYTRLAR